MTESKAAAAKREAREDRAEAKAEQAREDRAEDKAQSQLKPTLETGMHATTKASGPTAEQIEAARKLRAQGPAAAAEPPVVIVDPDPRPIEPSWNGKDEDFPAWVQADMRFKEALGAWMDRHRKV